MNPSIGWPLSSNVIRENSISNTFGMVRHNPDGTPKAHQGWDLAASIGTPCFAIADGIVQFANVSGDFGLLVVHSFVLNGITYHAAYAHLDAASVVLHAPVQKGQSIARTGASGNAAGLPPAEMHLHFEIRTAPMPGLGLAGRISPLQIYHVCPLHQPIANS